jgi:hypothetical protein
MPTDETINSNLSQLLAAFHGSKEVSERALQVGELASNFLASANAFADLIRSEASGLRASGVDISAPQVTALAGEFSYFEVMVRATIEAATTIVDRLHEK